MKNASRSTASLHANGCRSATIHSAATDALQSRFRRSTGRRNTFSSADNVAEEASEDALPGSTIFPLVTTEGKGHESLRRPKIFFGDAEFLVKNLLRKLWARRFLDECGVCRTTSRKPRGGFSCRCGRRKLLLCRGAAGARSSLPTADGPPTKGSRDGSIPRRRASRWPSRRGPAACGTRGRCRGSARRPSDGLCR